MEDSHDGPHELERLLEHQMRVQERQLAWARLGMVVLAAVLLVAVAPDLEGIGVLLGILGVLAALSLATPFLLRRFPAREVGIVGTVAEMAVTIAVYVASDALDAYLFYGLVILGVALRFGLAASIWASLVMSGLYVAVVLAGGGAGEAVRELLPARIAYLIGFGVAAGLFQPDRARARHRERARLGARLAEEEREQARRREAGSSASSDRISASSLAETTLRTIAVGAAPLLGHDDGAVGRRRRAAADPGGGGRTRRRSRRVLADVRRHAASADRGGSPDRLRRQPRIGPARQVDRDR